VPEEIPRVTSRRSSRARGPSRSAILNVSRRLYAASDYSGVTMRSIAKKVGCRSPSLYHYFQSKDEIFRALAEEGLTLFERFMPTSDSTDPLDRLWWRFWRYYEFSKAHPEYFRLLFIDRPSPVGDETLHSRAMSGVDTHRCVEACVAAGLLPQGTDPVETAVVLYCAIHGAAVLGMLGQCTPLTADLLAECTLRLAIDGVRAGLLNIPSTPSSERLADVRIADAAVDDTSLNGQPRA
jgi:AcrR family transcriptional regulator